MSIEIVQPEAIVDARFIRLGGKHGQGKFALVSPEDFEFINQFNWWLTPQGYVRATWLIGGERKSVNLHRVVAVRAGITERLRGRGTKVIDHRNRNTLDCTRANLREITQAQNSVNRGLHGQNTTGFLGVYPSKKAAGYVAAVNVGKKTYAIYPFDTAEKAAIVRDALARYYHGEFATTNFEGAEAYSFKQARINRRLELGQGSRYSGVFRNNVDSGKPWEAKIYVKAKGVYLGRFDSEIDAAKAVDDSRAVNGLDRVNFPDG